MLKLITCHHLLMYFACYGLFVYLFFTISKRMQHPGVGHTLHTIDKRFRVKMHSFHFNTNILVVVMDVYFIRMVLVDTSCL